MHARNRGAPHRRIRNQRPMRTSQSAARGAPKSRADIPSKRQLPQGDLSHTRPSRAALSLTEGDLIIGKRNQTAIGTLVERSTGYVMLLHLPEGYKPEQVRDALAAKIKTLPESLRLSLTWDQGPEMNEWEHVSVDAGIDIYFCDPHSPWQRGTNENTVSVGGAAFGLIGQAWCWQSEATLENTGHPPGCAFRLTCPLSCRHRPGPLVLA